MLKRINKSREEFILTFPRPIRMLCLSPDPLSFSMKHSSRLEQSSQAEPKDVCEGIHNRLVKIDMTGKQIGSTLMDFIKTKSASTCAEQIK